MKLTNSFTTWLYIKCNLNKVLPVVFIIALSTLALISTKSLTSAIVSDYSRLGHLFEKIAFIQVTSDNIENKKNVLSYIEEGLNNNSNIDEFIPTHVEKISMSPLVGDAQTWVLFVDPNDVKSLILHLNLVADTNYDDSFELLLTDSLLNNKGVDVGERIGSAHDSSEELQGDLLLSGQLTNNSDIDLFMGIGNLATREQQSDNTSSGYLILLQNDTDQLAVHNLLENLSNNVDSTTHIEYGSLLYFNNQIDDDYGDLDKMVWIIVFVISIVVTFSTSLLYIIYFSERIDEFGLLHAIGYTKKFIFLEVFKELSIEIILGWSLGVLLSVAINQFVNTTIFLPKSLAGFPVFDLQSIYYSLPIVIFLFLTSFFVVRKKLYKMDPIEIIERGR